MDDVDNNGVVSVVCGNAKYVPSAAGRELYSACAGFVVNDNSAIGFNAAKPAIDGDRLWYVGVRDGDAFVECGVYTIRCVIWFSRSKAFSSDMNSSSLVSCGTTSGFLSSVGVEENKWKIIWKFGLMHVVWQHKLFEAIGDRGDFGRKSPKYLKPLLHLSHN